MSSVISFTTALCHAITTFRNQRPPPPNSSLLTSPLFHHVTLRFPTPEQFVPWCGIRLLQNCRTGSTDAKVGSEQKGGPALRGQTGPGKVAARKKNQCIEAFYSGAPPIFPFPWAPTHHHILILAWSINGHSTVCRTASHRKRQHEEVGHLLAGGWKVNRRPNSAYGKGKVVAAQVVIAQPPGFHVSCFPKPLLMHEEHGPLNQPHVRCSGAEFM